MPTPPRPPTPRLLDPKGIRPGASRFRAFIVVGTLTDVKATLNALAKGAKRSR